MKQPSKLQTTGLRRAIRGLTLFAACLLAPAAIAQDCGDLFEPTQVLDFHITMDPADWEALRISCPAGFCGSSPHFYWSATFRCEDGPEIVVGIRRKNGSAEPSESDPQKPALKIDVNEFVSGQTLSGKVKLDLENGGGSSGGGGGSSDNGISEGFAWLLYGDASIVASRIAWVNVWVNGDLKGLYTHVEQVDKAMLIDHGIDDGGFLFKGPSGDQRTREGEANPYAFNWYPFDHTNPDDPQPADWRDQIEWRVDLDQMLRVAAAASFVSNRDAAIFKNNNYWYYDWAVFPDGQQPRLYLGWDLDTVLRDVDHPILGIPHNNGHIAQALIRDDPALQADYYRIFGELLAGPWSPAATTARVDALEPVLTPHIDADPYASVGSAAEQFGALRDFLQNRTAFVTAGLGSCPDAVCEAAESSCICPADCGPPPGAETGCADGIDEDCDGPTDCDDSDCALDAACVDDPQANRIVVNEVVANSPGSPDVEYIEILNAGPGAQDLSGWYVLDDDNVHDKCFLDGTLQPGEYLIVAGLLEDFNQRYPEAISVVNPNPFDSDVSGSGFSLGDGSDAVRLFRPGVQGDLFVDGFTYGPQSEERPFGYLPHDTDAPEYLTAPTPGATNELAAVWSPICINEFLTTSLTGGIDDWVELYNRGAGQVDVSGWHLSDSATNPTKYTFPLGSLIPAGGFLSVDESELGFALSSTGSEVIVLTGPDGEAGQDYYDFGTQFPDVSRGRSPDGAPNWAFFESPTRGVSNGCAGSVPDAVSGLVFAADDELSWDAVAGAGGYDVVRGDLGQLRAAAGDYSAGIVACEADDAASTGLTVNETPDPGLGMFWLIRAVDAGCSTGTYGSGSPVERPGRDLGIAASGLDCG